jgi:hypothetical protein
MDKCKRNSGLHSPALPPPPPSSQRKGPPGLVWRPSRLNTRDREIVEALSFRVRVFSVEQITSHWFGDGGGAAAAADRRLRLLERAGMVERFPMLARPVIPLDAPVVAWAPAGTPPSFTELSTYCIVTLRI